MKRLDSNRLAQGIDPVLEEFLVCIHEEDTVRRTMTSFPEYFTDAPLDHPVPLKLLEMRYMSLLDAWGGSALEETVKWFGISLKHFVKGEASIHEHPLPVDFECERSGSYNGLSDREPWIVSLCRKDNVQPEEFLVIQTIDAGETLEEEYFLSAVPLQQVTIDDGPEI